MDLSADQREELLQTLMSRFEGNMQRHKKLKWPDVEARLQEDDRKLWSLQLMEQSGGEPDVVGQDPKTDDFLFFDCALESPKGRRSVCFDFDARVARKKFPPESSAFEMAAKIGIELLTEAEYRALQKLGKFDQKTSSWVQTPTEIRELGGALFMDRRYDTVFLYHNGADSYYAARGFRGSLRV